jgi:galactose mutarotase-like enzyme
MYFLENEQLKVTINPKGAELLNWNRKNQKNYMWEWNPEFWVNTHLFFFPIVGTLKNDTPTYNEKNIIYPDVLLEI